MNSTTTTPERQRSRFDARRRPRRGAIRTTTIPVVRRGPRTLEDLIAVAADRLERTAPADCPVCGRAELTPAGCSACGSQLS
jgi:hypothetical protein